MHPKFIGFYVLPKIHNLYHYKLVAERFVKIIIFREKFLFIKIDNADMSNIKKIIISFTYNWSFIFSFFFCELLIESLGYRESEWPMEINCNYRKLYNLCFKILVKNIELLNFPRNVVYFRNKSETGK